ncbi:MAG: ATP-binding protein [Nitrospiraceae bacterium]|nr:ATP-binding protein [Nitrospiraceae bacterium]
MTERTVALIALGAIVVAAGALIAWGTSRRYRRELGLHQEAQERTPDVSFIISAFQDVTRQLKEKERELERLKSLAERRAETVESSTANILECVSNGVVTFDGKGNVATMNRAAEEILNEEKARTIGRSCEELFHDNDGICRTIRAALDKQVPQRRMETVLRRRNERIWLGFNTAMLTDRQGAVLGVILSFSDLTEVKRLQEQVELKERLTALGEMSAGIAHELRNPMAVIAGYLKLLAKQQDDTGRAIINDVQAEIQGMNRIIGDLLTFARPAALNRVPVALGELAASCAESVLQARGGSGIALDLQTEPATAMVDEGLMRQALCNIIQNAVDAMPQGGALSVRVRQGRNDELLILVRDTGAGIAPELLQKIFLPFFTTREKGVGMGLALAHKIVTSHGGRIEVESDPGSGTTFAVVLPAA